MLTGTVGGCATTKKTDQAAVRADTQESAPPQACTAQPGEPSEAEKKSQAKAEAEKEANRAKLTRELEIALRKVARAQLAADHQEADNEKALQKAAGERELAAAKLEDFDKQGAPVRLEKAQLSLKRAEDNVLESREELEQLQMMYGEEELGEKTSEIVIARAKRRLERAEWNLNIQRQELQDLQNATIPLERRELQLKQEAAEAELQSTQRTAESSLLEKRIALMSAEAEVAHIQTELKNLDVE
jgi:hypothetical protein